MKPTKFPPHKIALFGGIALFIIGVIPCQWNYIKEHPVEHLSMVAVLVAMVLATGMIILLYTAFTLLIRWGIEKLFGKNKPFGSLLAATLIVTITMELLAYGNTGKDGVHSTPLLETVMAFFFSCMSFWLSQVLRIWRTNQKLRTQNT